MKFKPGDHILTIKSPRINDDFVGYYGVVVSKEDEYYRVNLFGLPYSLTKYTSSWLVREEAMVLSNKHVYELLDSYYGD